MTATTRWVQTRRKLHLHDTSTTQHRQIWSSAEHENERTPRQEADKHKCSTIAEGKNKEKKKKNNSR